MAACVHIFGVIFYGFFASAEKQYWAEPHEDIIRLYDEDDGFEDRKAYENYGATSNEVNITFNPHAVGIRPQVMRLTFVHLKVFGCKIITRK